MKKEFKNKDIIEGIRTSNSQVIQYVYEYIKPDVIKRLNGKYSNTNEDVEEIFHISVIATYNAIRNNPKNREYDFKNYIYLACANEIKKKIKKNVQEQGYIEEYTRYSQIEDDIESKNSYLTEFVQDFERLCDKCKKLFILKANGYSFKEIAEEFGYKNAQIAKNKRQDCVKKLRNMINNKN